MGELKLGEKKQMRHFSKPLVSGNLNNRINRQSCGAFAVLEILLGKV